MQSASLQLAILQLQSQTSEDLGRPPQKTTLEDLGRPLHCGRPWETISEDLGRLPWKILEDHLGRPPWKTLEELLGRPLCKTWEDHLGRPWKTLENLSCLEGVKIKMF